MSDNYTTYLSLDCPADDAQALVDDVLAWITSPNRDPDASSRVNDEVTGSAEWHHVSGLGNSVDSALTCPRCGRVVPQQMDKIKDWFQTQEEPFITCIDCGEKSLIGDWSDSYGNFFTHASITFHATPKLDGTPLLDPAMEQELLRHLGRRSRVVYTHM